MLDELLDTNRINEWETICGLADHALQEFIEQNCLTHNSIVPKKIILTQAQFNKMDMLDYLLVAYFIVSDHEIALKQLLYKYCKVTNDLIETTNAVYPLSRYVLPYMQCEDHSEVIIVTDPITVKDKLIDFYLSDM